MAKKYSALICISTALIVLSACSGETSPQLQAMQRKDKQLSCKEVLLEMNEAQFYKKMAQKNKDPKLKTVLMPLGYISTYMGADEAMESASARIDYLDKIYDIMNCDKPNNTPMQQPVSSYQQQGRQPAYVGTNYSPNPNSYSQAPTGTPSTYYQDQTAPQQQNSSTTQNNGGKFW